MKNKKDIKKIWLSIGSVALATLSIGSVALATLPITSVISCSNNDSKPQNPDNGNGGNNSGSEDNKPDTKEIINYSETFHYGDAPNLWADAAPSRNSSANLIKNFLIKYKTKILNNEIKFFDENNNPIHYEIDITINKGLYVSGNGYDINKPYNPIADYADRNFYKKTNADAHFKLEFWKKENNQSYTTKDFNLINLGEENWFSDPFVFGSNFIGQGETTWINFPKESAIGYIIVDDKNNKVIDGILLSLYVGKKGMFLCDGDEKINTDSIDGDVFSPNDSASNNLLLAQSRDEISPDWFRDGLGLDVINLDGTITIKQKV